MEHTEIDMCRAIVQQGERKGEKCQRAKTQNGFCVYHQRNYEYEEYARLDKKPCGMFFRGCNNELSQEDITKQYKHCLDCRRQKSGKSFPCQYKDCTFHITKENDKYCKKHIRQLLRDNEQDTNIRYCDINRGCFNVIISGNKCESCKESERQEAAVEIDTLRQKHNITNPTGILLSPLHKQQEEKTISVSELWRGIQRNAYSRGLLFTLAQDDFERIAIQPCYYCGFFSKSRLNGIDRINNNKGYIIANCLPCCKMCNMMKNIQHPNEFIDKIHIIMRYKTENDSDNIMTYVNKWNNYLSKYAGLSYKKYQYSAKERCIEFLLTEHEYNELINGTCYLCGISSTKGHTNGIDRFDSSIRSYSLENSRTCCGHCNVMKGSLSYIDFIQKCEQVVKHNCNRSVFESVPIYDITKCRNEFYTADEIYDMMTNGKYNSFIEWCLEKGKTPDFLSIMNELCNSLDILENKQMIITRIREELEKERKRMTSLDNLNGKKNMQCTTMYCYLTQGKLQYYIDWYNNNYKKTSLFDEKLKVLIESLPALNREAGIQACKKFIYDEKNRRVIQERRENAKKVHTYLPEVKVPKQHIAPQVQQSTPEKNIIINPAIPVESIMPELYKKSIVSKVITIQQTIGYQKKELHEVKQWKVKQIYEAISTNQENQYKDHCEHSNNLSKNADWPMTWASFVLAVKGKPLAESETTIRQFVENLRTLRHNQLCYKKNASLVDREDREQWPATTVVRAFLDGKLDAFKKHTETQTGDNPEDGNWQIRWNGFVTSLEENRASEKAMKALCSRFLTAQRTKRYRREK